MQASVNSSDIREGIIGFGLNVYPTDVTLATGVG